MGLAELLDEGIDLLTEKRKEKPGDRLPGFKKGEKPIAYFGAPVSAAAFKKLPAKEKESAADKKAAAALTHMTNLLKGQGRKARKGRTLKDLAAWILRQLGGRHSHAQEEGLDVAKTILQQMGGTGKIKAMTGAKSFIGSDDGVSFQWPAKGGPNAVRIKLTSDDLYDVEFVRTSGSKPPKVLSKHEGIGAEALKGLFEKETGLRLSL